MTSPLGWLALTLWTLTLAPAALPSATPLEPQPTLDLDPEAISRRHRALEHPRAPWPEDGDTTLLTFAHLTDTHIGKLPETPEGPVDDADALALVIAEIGAGAARPQLVLVTGDLTDEGTDEQFDRFKKLRTAFGVPVHVVAGNHDVGFEPTPETLALWDRHFPEARGLVRVEAGPVTFLGFDSQLLNARFDGHDLEGRIQEQWGHLEGEVHTARALGRRVMLFCHIPALPSFFRHQVKASWRSPEISRLLRLVDREGVEAVLTGHFHRDETYVRGKTLYLNAPPVSRWETREPSFRLFRVTPRGLMFRQIYVEERSRHRSYEVDLRGLTEDEHRTWVRALEPGALRQLWEQRYAGDDASGRLWDQLQRDHFRRFLHEPFSYQPVGDRMRELGTP